MADNNIDVSVTAQVEDFLAGMNRVRFAIEGLSNPLRAVRDTLGEVADAFVAAFAVEKIGQFAKDMAELGLQTERSSQLLGVSAGTVATLDAAAQGAGSSMEGMVRAVARVGYNLAQAEAGSKTATAGFKALGISLSQFSSLNDLQRMELLADKFSKLKDGADKDAIGIALLGRGFQDLLPMLNQGSESFQQYADMVKRAGAEATPEFLADAHEMHQAIIEFGLATRGAGETLFTYFEPAIAGVTKAAFSLVEQFTASVREGGAMYYVVQTLAVAMRGLATALVISVGAIETLWEVTKAAVFAMGEAFMSLGRIIKDVFTFNWGDVSAAWGDLQAQLVARAKISADNMQEVFKNLTGQLKTIWQSSADEQVKIEQDKRAKLGIVNTQAVSEALKLIELKYQNEVQKIEATYGKFIFSEGAKTQALLQALDARHNAELAVAGTTAAQRLIMDQKYVNDREKIMIAAQKQEEKDWNTAFSAIQSSFNSQLRGLLAGTTTFGQAMKNVLADLTIKFVEMLEKWAFEWLAHQLAMTAVVQTQSAAQAATQTAAMAAGLPAKQASFLSDITARAALVFAGVFANLAPFIGPAASGPAAASQATVLAQAAAIPKFDVGTDYVLRTGLATLHRGETVTPAAVAQGSGPYTGAGSSGGVTIEMNGMMVGTQAFLNSIMPQLAQRLSAYQSANPSLGWAGT